MRVSVLCANYHGFTAVINSCFLTVLKPGLWGLMWRGVKISSVSSQINYGLCGGPSATAWVTRLIGSGPRSSCRKAILADIRLPMGVQLKLRGSDPAECSVLALTAAPTWRPYVLFSTHPVQQCAEKIKLNQMSVNWLGQNEECWGGSTRVVVIVISVFYCY